MIALKKGDELIFKRFNGVKSVGRFLSIDRTGKRGAWLTVKPNKQDDPIKIRRGQIIKVNGQAVI